MAARQASPLARWVEYRLAHERAVEIAQHIEAIRREGRLLASAAERTDLNVPIPTCPDWRMRDLLQHIGGIHRWAAAHVAERRAEPLRDYTSLVGDWPPDDELIAWFRAGCADLARVLETAEPDVQCWSLFPAPSPLAFWARRQAHETGVHRADGEGARGPMTAFEPAVAADGIDELLLGFVPRPRSKLRSEAPRALHVQTTDVEGDWLVHIQSDKVEVRKEKAAADCSVSGPASDLFLMLWNRRGTQGLDVIGDGALLELWRERVQVRWG
jgi:uncharacterized protein (TIGR03083 family)